VRKVTKDRSIKRVETEFSSANDKTKSNKLAAENMIFKSIDISTHSHAFTSFIKMRLQLILFIALCHASLLAQTKVNKIDFIECANESMNKGDFITAIDQYNTLILINPNDTESYFNRAIIESDFGDEKSAIQDFTKCITMDSSQVDYFFLRGISYKNLGELLKAEQDFIKANALEPSNADIHMHLGDVLFDLKKYESAILEYNKSLKLKDDNASHIFYQLSQIDLLQNKNNEYAHHLKMAVDTNANNALAASTYIKYLLEESKSVEAVHVLFRMLGANKELRYDIQTFDMPVALQKDCLQKILIQTKVALEADSIDMHCLQARALLAFGMLNAAKKIVEELHLLTDVRVQYVKAIISLMEKDYQSAKALTQTNNNEYALRFSTMRLNIYQETKNRTAYCEEMQKNKNLQHRFFETSMCEVMK